MNIQLKHIQRLIDNFKKENPNESVGELSDTYHSFDDLYKHRTILSALLFLNFPYSWKSKIHEDGTMYDGMFVTGFPTPTGMVSYHYDLEYWDLFKIPEIPHAPHFDGYTDNDVLIRLTNIIKNSSTKLFNADDINKIEDIVKSQILPTFGDDIIKKAAYISFFNKY